MSFRVKPTHSSIQQYSQAISISQNDSKNVTQPDKSKKIPKPKTAENILKSQEDNRPKSSSDKGLAIRTVSNASSDHM